MRKQLIRSILLQVHNKIWEGERAWVQQNQNQNNRKMLQIHTFFIGVTFGINQFGFDGYLNA